MKLEEKEKCWWVNRTHFHIAKFLFFGLNHFDCNPTSIIFPFRFTTPIDIKTVEITIKYQLTTSTILAGLGSPSLFHTVL
ncbi:hypothetical protein HanIR_Chr12g0598211 [Helianthus annuus]|nr:hypothetical protein HanIR_Chr12g0598211 [Helianthus annuus]